MATLKPDKAREVVLLLCLLRVSERRALICLRGIVQVGFVFDTFIVGHKRLQDFSPLQDLQDAYPTTIQEDEVD